MSKKKPRASRVRASKDDVREPSSKPQNESQDEPQNESQDEPQNEPSSKPQNESQDEPSHRQGKFLIVGVGASAGGLEALSELLKHVPLDAMAFVVVQHLAPDHESLLTELLARSSRLEVVTAKDGMTLEPNRVFVIPPNTDLAVLHGVIQLMTPSATAKGPRLPIDYLFRSLAADQGTLAVGVVLSGTGTDGTFGLKAIKAAGGLTFVQDPASAKYDGMPQSALSSGCADFCLTPKQIGEELSRIARRPHLPRAVQASTLAPQAQDYLGKLFVLIRAEFGTDLSHYKLATVDRRIERRMTLHRIERLDAYVKYVQSSREELHALYKDMLITVTSFFRDPDAFEALARRILAPLVERTEAHGSIRVWVPACATGEEAYSLAICLLELCEAKGRDAKIQLFGTDIDEDSIQRARRGVYLPNISADVSPERLNRFFVKKNNEYTISRRVRDLVVFSKQNILKDAPFSRIDLASCRNLLIYLQPAAQQQVLRILHYALNPSGHLLLGSSETVGDAPSLFSLVDGKHKIYAKKHLARPVGIDMSFGAPAPLGAPKGRPAARPTLNLQAVADRKVLELYGPAGVVINEDLEILQFRGHSGPYLDPAPGAASFNILKLARFELHVALKQTIEQALSRRVRVRNEVSYRDDGQPAAVMLDVVPLEDPESKARCLLVLFHPLPVPKEIPVASSIEGHPSEALLPLDRRIHELEHELTVTKDYLQTTIEERESTNEELQNANEELQSSNEELQSTNEELETSKEELQSTNEELTTVNEELHNRMVELSQVNDDLHNVLTGVDNAVVIAGMDLRLRRYTAAAEKLFNLVPGDVGRSINFLDPFLGSTALESKVSSVISTLASTEESILATNRRWYTLKISPYKTLDHSIRGAFVSLMDVDVRKRAEDLTRNVGAYAEQFLGAIGHPLLMMDKKMRVVWANAPFFARFQLAADETVGSLLPSVAGGQWADPRLRERVDGVFDHGAPFRDLEMQLEFRDLGQITVSVGGSQVPVSTETSLLLLSIEPFGGASPAAIRGGPS